MFTFHVSLSYNNGTKNQQILKSYKAIFCVYICKKEKSTWLLTRFLYIKSILRPNMI